MATVDVPIPLCSKRNPKPTAKTGLSPVARAVWDKCALRRGLGPQADDLLSDAREELFAVGDVVYDASNADGLPLIVIIDGLVRVYCTSSQGRQATIRYATPGQVVGLPFALAPHMVAENANLAAQAVSSCRLLRLSPQTFRRVAESDARNMWYLFGELAEATVAGERLLAQNLFQPIRARVARHMLGLSEKRGSQLVVAASQQDIADAIGSVREVISRIIMQIRDEGLIRREGGVYVILDSARMALLSEEE